jgi:hypothetical protein
MKKQFQGKDQHNKEIMWSFYRCGNSIFELFYDNNDEYREPDGEYSLVKEKLDELLWYAKALHLRMTLNEILNSGMNTRNKK